jgi:predicted alpha/beta-fold hydrolase
VDDYYARASCKRFLSHIATPTLIINARNDPFLPPHALPVRDELSDYVQLDTPQHGGHVGFVSGRFPGNIDWLTQRVLRFFADAL